MLCTWWRVDHAVTQNKCATEECPPSDPDYMSQRPCSEQATERTVPVRVHVPFFQRGQRCQHVHELNDLGSR